MTTAPTAVKADRLRSKRPVSMLRTIRSIPCRTGSVIVALVDAAAMFLILSIRRCREFKHSQVHKQ